MKKAILVFTLLLNASVADSLFAQQPPPNDGPWARDLQLTFSTDGTRFDQSSAFTQAGGVPSVVRDSKGRLVAAFQWFPTDTVNQAAFDKVAVRISEDGGKTWGASQPIQIEGFPTDMQRPFDPTLVVLADGRIRIYFTSSQNQNPGPLPITGFYSAISTDGVNYTFEPGVRFAVEGKTVVDCAVLVFNGQFHLTCPAGTPQEGAFHAVSTDGLTFTRLDTIPSVDGVNWTGNLVAYDTEMRFYGTDTGRGIWWVSTKDGTTWTRPTYTNAGGGDPGVAVVEGKLLMIHVARERNSNPTNFIIVTPPNHGQVVDSSKSVQVSINWRVFPASFVAATQSVAFIGKRDGAAFETTISANLPGNQRSATLSIQAGDVVTDGQVVVRTKNNSGTEIVGKSGVFTVGVQSAPDDTEKPVVVVMSPASGARIESASGAQVRIAWVTTDNRGAVAHALKLSGNRGGTAFETTIAAGLPGTATFFNLSVTPNDAVSDAVVRVEATDAAGNVGTGRSGTFSIVAPSTADTQKPVVSDVVLNKRKVVRKKDPTLTITWKSSDNVGVASHDVLFAGDGVTFSTVITTGLSGATQNFTWSLPANLSKTKTGAVKVIAKDAAGNTGEATAGGSLIVK